MKPIILFVFIFTPLIAFTQKSQISGQIIKTDSLLRYHYLTVSLKHADLIIQEAVPDEEGKFTLGDINRGFYNLIIKRLHHKDYLADSLLVVTDKSIYLNVIYPPPCKHVYVKGQMPKCIDGHTDQIIPIVYGLPLPKTAKKAKQGLLKLGGCFITKCDPQYYCTLHKIKL